MNDQFIYALEELERIAKLGKTDYTGELNEAIMGAVTTALNRDQANVQVQTERNRRNTKKRYGLL